jgi:hypothetical protein
VTDDDTFGRLRTRLAELADAPAPGSPFDAVRTAATGRRRVLARRTSTVGGTGVLAVAAVFGIAAVFGPGGSSASGDTGPASGIGADPMATYFDYGWLPASLPYVSYTASSIATHNDTIAQGDLTSPIGAPRVDLEVLPGNVPGTPNDAERFIPAKLDDGRPAYWVTQSYSHGDFAGDFQLRFPAKDGHWLSLTWGVNVLPSTREDYPEVAGVPTDPKAGPGSSPPASVPVSAQWQKDLLRIATQVTNTPTQIPMPLRITGLPGNFQPSSTILWRPGDFGREAPGTWSVLLSFSAPGGGVSIDVGPHGTVADEKLPVKDAECKTVNGLDACVTAFGHLSAFEEIGGAKGLLKMVTLLGTDENQWTTSVLVP